MKRNYVKTTLLISAIATMVSCKKNHDHPDYKPPVNEPQATVLSAAGDSAAIIGTINQFRSILGDSLNVAPGKTSGRREVNWDGVPAALTNNNNFPVDFFNSTNPEDPNGRKRGLVYIDAGNGFRVDSSSFSQVDPSYAGQFPVFSKKRLFTQMGNYVYEAVFKVPGTGTDASIHGFGAVFSDVDIAGSSTLEFFEGNKSLGVFKVKASPQSFSFLGVHFEGKKITRVKFTTGNGVLGEGLKDISDGGSKDLVVLDDFFYDEPVAL